jgi:two-component system alkaline phosphatase synthesis response regulator PhoP
MPDGAVAGKVAENAGWVCVVEDDDNIRELVVYALASAGFRASGFADGAAFFAGLGGGLPSLLLLDIMLPGDDGISILRRLKSVARTSSLPVIMLTAKNSEFDRIRGLDLGADDYVTKPFSVLEVISRVRAVLRRSSGAALGGTGPAAGLGGSMGAGAALGGTGPAAGLGGGMGAGAALGAAAGAGGDASEHAGAAGTAGATHSLGAAGLAGPAAAAGAVGAAGSSAPVGSAGTAGATGAAGTASAAAGAGGGAGSSAAPSAAAGAGGGAAGMDADSGVSVGRVVLRLDRRAVYASGTEIPLTYKEFELLYYLMANEGIVISRDKLLSKIWGFDYSGETRTVDMHIKSLRQKLGGDGALIKTVRNVGYKIGG